MWINSEGAVAFAARCLKWAAFGYLLVGYVENGPAMVALYSHWISPPSPEVGLPFDHLFSILGPGPISSVDFKAFDVGHFLTPSGFDPVDATPHYGLL